MTQVKQSKARYQPNVSAFISLCGRNYAHILKWLPDDVDINTSWVIDGQFGQLNVKLLENTRYTQLVEISRCLPKQIPVVTPKVTVRIYHDAQLAEVLTSQQIYRLKAVYDYPNMHMHQTDEKYQVNAFLEEVLKIGKLKQLC